MKLGEDDIAINNIWRKFEIHSISMPNLPMSEFYMDIKKSLLTLLRFHSACSFTRQKLIGSCNTQTYTRYIFPGNQISLWMGFWLPGRLCLGLSLRPYIY